MKREIGRKNCLYPLPTTLVGANVNGKPNFIAIAHVGILDTTTISLGMNKSHFTNNGTKENKTFSVNIPSITMVKETDYCGLVSGKDIDKSTLFQTFYGKLKTAPMISTCPVNLECRLIQTMDLPHHDVFIGEIMMTYCDEIVLTKGVLDYKKLNPILFTMQDQGYWMLGERIATAWNIGKELYIKK
jgi:flavin reductase (DIM6/NTAB) family NADH-FMN oxidoreductase RutF